MSAAPLLLRPEKPYRDNLEPRSMNNLNPNMHEE
jgi:hypothetical protein